MPIFWHLMEVNLKQLKQKEAVKTHLNVGAQAAGVSESAFKATL